MTRPYFHLEAKMSGDRAEDTSRRAEAFGIALMHAATDPQFRAAMGSPELPETPFKRFKLELGRAYSDLHAGLPRSQVTRRLRELMDSHSEMLAAAKEHHPRLAEIVRARTIGARCGDHISQTQLDLLTDALTLPAAPPKQLTPSGDDNAA